MLVRTLQTSPNLTLAQSYSAGWTRQVSAEPRQRRRLESGWSIEYAQWQQKRAAKALGCRRALDRSCEGCALSVLDSGGRQGTSAFFCITMVMGSPDPQRMERYGSSTRTTLSISLCVSPICDIGLANQVS
jgi:hypothetical protein